MTGSLFCAGALLTLAAIGGYQLVPPAGAMRTVVEDNSAPDWVGLPARGVVRAPGGAAIQPMHSVVLTRDNPREAALVGTLRNRGDALEHVRLTLEYLGSGGERIGARVDNQAAVSAAPRDGVLPFRFPLAAATELAGTPAYYAVVLAIDPQMQARGWPHARVQIARTRNLGRRGGTRVEGTLTVDSAAERIDAANVAVTLLLLDETDRPLDVLVDRPFGSASGPPSDVPWKLEMRGSMPVARRVRNVVAWVEVRGQS